MDNNECQTLIAAARNSVGREQTQILADINAAAKQFSAAAMAKFNRKGEW
jgi:hypothetical protein